LQYRQDSIFLLEEEEKLKRRKSPLDRLSTSTMSADASRDPAEPMETTMAAEARDSAHIASTAPSGGAADATTWSFVQMNMSLLPIARPLPVTTVCHRFQESFQPGKKPRTPNQKLHRRVLQNASNISPRRHDVGGVARRTSSASRAASVGSAASPRSPFSSPQARDQSLRIWLPGVESSSSRSSPSSSSSSSSFSPVNADLLRVRSQSEDRMQRTSSKRGCETSGGGYASDSSDSFIPARGEVQLSRSASLSAACDLKAYKGKRIMELLDEERRLRPEERSGAGSQSPTKRSRHQ